MGHDRERVRFGLYTVDLRAAELKKGQDNIPLQNLPFRILELLLREPGRVVTREELRQELWPADTFVDFERGISTAVSKLRDALGDSATNPRFIETVGRRGYRFIAPVMKAEFPLTAASAGVAAAAKAVLTEPSADAKHFEAPARFNRNVRNLSILAVVMLIVGLSGILFYQRFRRPQSFTDKDTVILADFTNTTGDSIFDHALKQALSAELTESPFLNIASDLRVSDMLRHMGRPPNDALTREVATEVCLRLGGKAVVVGSIAKMGSHYVVGLQVLGCANKDMLGAFQVEAANKESVVKAVHGLAAQLRRKLGESLASLEKYDYPVTTTKSLDALKAYSLGSRALRERGEGEAIPFFRYAIELDPEFALAYATLGRACEDVGQDEDAIDNYTKAFALRNRLSERDRYYVSTLYHETVTGNMEQAKTAAVLWVRAYPRDAIAREKLGTLYGELGDFENANAQFREALRLDPDSAVNVFNAVQITAALNRWEEAIGILRSAQTRGLDGPLIREITYSMAFLCHDHQEMDRQTAWGIGKINTEEVLLSQDSDSKAYYGHLREARQLTSRAVAAASRDQSKETAALCELAALLRETEVGIRQRKQTIVSTFGPAPSRNVRLLAALVLARSGNAPEANALATDLENTNPANTLVRLYWLPTIRASIELRAGNPQMAISHLQTAAPYELAITSNLSNAVNMYPNYVRGQAYLSVREGALAAAEFKRVLEHPGVAQNSIVSALSQLQLARAEIMMGDSEAGRKDYSSFLSLWNTADDVPIVRQARIEYRKIQ